MSGKCAPKFSECLDATLVASHSEFEVIARVNIDDDSQSGGQDHIEGSIDVAQVGRVKNRRIGWVVEQRRRLNRKAHVIETHRFDERDVLGRGVSFEMRLRVIGRLRKPVTKIDSAPQAFESRGQIYRAIICLRIRLRRNS